MPSAALLSGSHNIWFGKEGPSMREITTMKNPTPASSEWEIAQDFAQRKLWPYRLRKTPGLKVPAHYHLMDEELYVVEGRLDFFDLHNRPEKPLTVVHGEGARIPQGAVHRVDVGPTGATYVMGLPE